MKSKKLTGATTEPAVQPQAAGQKAK